MPGFAQLGSPGFSIAPPRLTPAVGGNTMRMLGIPQYTGGQAGFINPESNVGSSRLDTSPEHNANTYLARTGLGNLGASHGPSEDPYGFNAADWNHINSFVSNPLDVSNASNYQQLVGRMRSTLGGQIPGLNGTEFNQFTLDLPLRTGSSYGILPPTAMQNWNIPAVLAGMRF